MLLLDGEPSSMHAALEQRKESAAPCAEMQLELQATRAEVFRHEDVQRTLKAVLAHPPRSESPFDLAWVAGEWGSA
jgi:hypothetical protein